jgi:hypothetical protein
MIYKVYFQLYGKKMKASVIASSPEEAKEMVINEIEFDKVVVVNVIENDVKNNDPTVEHLKNMFGLS